MKLEKLLQREYILVFIIIAIFISISIFPTYYYVFKAPKGTVFSQAYNFYPDFYQFISWMKDGANGHLGLTSRFSPEVFPRRYAHILFPIMGFIGSKLGIDLFSTFTLSRVIWGILRLAVLYILIVQLIKSRIKRIFIFLLSIILPGFWYGSFNGGQFTPQIFLSDITNFDVLRRITFLPHHMLAGIFMMLLFIALAKAIERDNITYTLIAGLLFWGGAISNPATILDIAVVLPFAFIIFVFSSYSKRKIRLVIHFGLIVLFIAAVSLYYKFLVFDVYPWNGFYQGELSTNVRWSFWEYVGGLGIALPLAILNIKNRKSANSSLIIFLESWALAPILGFLIFTNIFHSYIFIFRLFQAQQFIPLGILAGLGIFYIYERWKSRLTMLIVTILILGYSLPNIFFSLQTQMAEMKDYNYFVYLPKDTLKAFQFLDKNTPPESVVWAGFYMGQLLPAYSHNRVYLGRIDGTYNYDDKVKKLTRFYSKQMTSAEAAELFKSAKVQYLFFGPDTPSPSDTILSQITDVGLIYQSGNNYIYKINY